MSVLRRDVLKMGGAGAALLVAGTSAVGQEEREEERTEAVLNGIVVRLPEAGGGPQTGEVTFPAPVESIIQIDVKYRIQEQKIVKASVDDTDVVGIRQFRMVREMMVDAGKAKPRIGAGLGVAVFTAKAPGTAMITINSGRGTYLYKIQVERAE